MTDLIVAWMGLTWDIGWTMFALRLMLGVLNPDADLGGSVASWFVFALAAPVTVTVQMAELAVVVIALVIVLAFSVSVSLLRWVI